MVNYGCYRIRLSRRANPDSTRPVAHTKLPDRGDRGIPCTVLRRSMEAPHRHHHRPGPHTPRDAANQHGTTEWTHQTGPPALRLLFLETSPTSSDGRTLAPQKPQDPPALSHST